MTTVKILPNDRSNPPGKLADAEIHFADPVCPICLGDRELQVADSGPLAGAVGICTTCDGHGVLVGANPLAGLKLIGFGIWERRGAGGRNVTFPAPSTRSMASADRSPCCNRSSIRPRRIGFVS